MTPEQIREIVRQEMESSSKGKQFNVAPNSFHTHNKIDSQGFPFLNLKDVPKSYYQNSTTSYAGYNVVVNSTATGLTFASGSKAYGGYVNSNGTAGTPFPTGWTSTKTGTGAYTITHNLNTTSYVVVALAGGASFHVGAEYAINANSFDISWVTTAASLQDAAFMFILLPQ